MHNLPDVLFINYNALIIIKFLLCPFPGADPGGGAQLTPPPGPQSLLISVHRCPEFIKIIKAYKSVENGRPVPAIRDITCRSGPLSLLLSFVFVFACQFKQILRACLFEGPDLTPPIQKILDLRLISH